MTMSYVSRFGICIKGWTPVIKGSKPVYPYGVFENEEDYRDRFF